MKSLNQLGSSQRQHSNSQKRDTSPTYAQLQNQQDSNQLQELTQKLRQSEIETSNAYSMLKQEQARRRELEERLDSMSTTDDYQQYLNTVKQLLKEREPNLEQLMDITLKKERQEQERKDAKILDILKIKDQQLEEIQNRCVSQEADYGKLASLFQEQKRRIKELEDQEAAFENQLSQSQIRLSHFEKGKEFQRLLETEDKLRESQDLLHKYEAELLSLQTKLEEKSQIDSYLEEAMDRYKEQLQDKESALLQVMRDLETEKERRIREEDQVKNLMHQLNQLHQESSSDRWSLNLQNDLVHRLNRLQDEKSDLIQSFDDHKRDKVQQDDQIRRIYERLLQVRGSNAYGLQVSLGNKSIVELLEMKAEDMARLIKELEDDNIDIKNKNQRIQQQLAQRETELQQVIEENEDLSFKYNQSKTKQTSKGAQTDLDNNDMDIYESLRDKCETLEDQNEVISKQVATYQNQLKHLKHEVDAKNQEIQLLTRGSFLKNNSMTTQSEVGHMHGGQGSIIAEQHEELVSKLNSKITTMKMNEEKYIEEISCMKEMLMERQDNGNISNAKSNQQTKANYIQSEERISEYESILLEQREQLIKLEEENASLKREIKDLSYHSHNQKEWLQLRLKNVQDLQRKQEQLISSNNLLTSEFSQHSSKSTAVETERMRQFAQNLELINMQLKHQVEEVQTENSSLQDQLSQAIDEAQRAEQIVIRLKQEVQMQRVGLGQGDQDAKLSNIAVEQRKKIKYLQGLLIRAKQDFDQLSKCKPDHVNQTSSLQTQRLEELVKTNERLRQEHQQAIMVVVDLKEEYSSKLMIMAEKHEQIRQKMIKENGLTQRRVEQMQTQLSYMEKKEMRLFGQLEEAKILQQQETTEKEARTKELEELLFKKEETINDLEREINMKTKALQERQEQLNVLLSSLEHEHSHDEMRQKILNLTAELCSVRAMESQQQRKVNEITHQLKKSELHAAKLHKQAEVQTSRRKELESQLAKVENEKSVFEEKIQDLTMQFDEKEREYSECKYRLEREEYQRQMKEDSLIQAREQLKRVESLFKDEVERIRKECYQQIGREYEHTKANQDINRTLQLKSAVQQLHLVIADYLNGKSSQQEHGIIQEFEKTLVASSQTIEKLYSDLDKAQFTLAKVNQNFKATALSKILLSRQEQLQIVQQKQQLHFNQREEERVQYIKTQEASYKKVIKEQDLRMSYLEKQVKGMEIDSHEMKEELRYLKDQKDEVEQTMMMFEQEIDNKRQAMERKAELTVDERFKAKHEAIKSYFDSNITRILLNTQSTSNEKMLELGRELLAHKLLISKMETQLLSEQSETQSLELNLGHYKELQSQQEQRVRDLQLKSAQLTSKVQHQELGTKMEIEKRKQEVSNTEKEVIKCREQLETKTREYLLIQDQVQRSDMQLKSSLKSSILTHQVNESEEQLMNKDQSLLTQSKQIEDLQEKLVELRTQHITELEDMRVHYELQLSSAHLQLQKDKEALEKRFMPGYAPGDILEQNQELQSRVAELRQALERYGQENTIVRKKLESERNNGESMRQEIEGYKQALLELESTMIEITQTQPQLQSQMRQEKSLNKMNQEKSKDKKSLKVKRQSSLHFNKDSIHSEESHSKINHHETSSLNVSALTSVNMIPTSQRNTQSIAGYTQSIMTQGYQRQFILNPPQIVKALVQSKTQEYQIKKKFEDQLKIEIELRSLLKNNKIQMIENYTNNETNQRLLEIEIENEDLKLQRTNQQVDILRATHQSQITFEKLDLPTQDYSTMIEALLFLTNQVASLESNSLYDTSTSQSIEEAQRLVIKSLTTKILADKGVIDNIQYVPSAEQDRKLWYLELLEQQVDTSERVIQHLQGFIKKLQIDIQGNLQSAAQIKAASMDLAQNTKQTSEEVKTLKHIVGLLKHDLTRNSQPSNNTIGQRTINPFAAGDQGKTTQYYDQLMSTNDQLQNQLTITEKVKKTLEQDVVNLKLQQAQELQSLQHKLSQAIDQRNSLLETNEELHERVQSLQSTMDKLKQELTSLSTENSHNQSTLLEKEREKQVIAQNKTATSKHLQKLQQDMSEWRKQTEENIKIKEKQIEDLTKERDTLQSERDRLKSECQMLRRVSKDRKSHENEDLKRLEQENKDLMDRLNQEIGERKKEIEFWVTERATMRQMIDQLESDKIEEEAKLLTVVDEDQVKQLKKKNYKKIKEKEVEIKSKEKQLKEAQDQMTKVKLTTTQMEHKLRELSGQLQEQFVQNKYLSQKVKEVELERDLILAERNNALSTSQAEDVTAQQVAAELNSLRECFAKLKVERDNLLYEMDSLSSREREWKSTVDKLQEEVQQMESQIFTREKEQNDKMKVLDTKNSTFMHDLKYLKSENDRLKERVKELDQQHLQYEQRIHQEQMKVQELTYNSEELQRQINDLKLSIRSKEQKIEDLYGLQLVVEARKLKDLDSLKQKIEDIKDSNAQLVALYENQLLDLKARFLQDKKRNEAQIDQMFTLGQRDAVIKQLKKELTTAKQQMQKIKGKNSELKQAINQVSNNQENVNQKQLKKLQQKTNMLSRSEYGGNIDDKVIKLAQQLISEEEGGYQQLMDQLQRTNQLVSKVVELEAELEKNNSHIILLNQQLQENMAAKEDMQNRMETLQRSQVKESKNQRQQQATNEVSKQYKQEVKALQQELEHMRQEWISPSDAKLLQERMRDYQSQIKSLKDEVLRKKDFISQVKLQKEATEVEANQIIADMEGLKDDNAKMQKLIKENNKNIALAKEYKGTNEYLRAQEKRLKDEINNLSEKIKQMKIEIQRKDQINKDYKDKLDYIQEEINQSKDRQNEIEKLKEANKKLKLETEIKDNQVKSLKYKLDHTENELEQNKQLSQSTVQASSTNQQQLESQMKLNKNKIKKYELYLKKSLEALRKIGKELTSQNCKTAKKSAHNRSSLDNPMKISEFEKDIYKDSVNILGMSIDELEDFMNPNQNVSVRSKDDVNFIAKLDKAVEIPETLNSDLEQICNYCMKLIHELNPDVKFN